MPNLSAAKKSLRSDARKAVFNLRRQRDMRGVIKEIKNLVSKGSIKEAQAKLPQAYKAIDKAAKRGVIKANNASRKKSRLSKFIKTNSQSK